jgi:hypothetical protein
MLITEVDIDPIAGEFGTMSNRNGRKIKKMLENIEDDRLYGKTHPAQLAWESMQQQLPIFFSSTEEIENGVIQLRTNMEDILESYAPKARLVAWSKPWWNEEISDARKKVGRFRRAKFTANWKASKRELKSLIKKAKKQSWQKWLKESEGDKVWDVLRGTKRTCKKLSSGPLTNEQGKIANTDEEKREMLAEISFPQ